jgi:hypothetical protein
MHKASYLPGVLLSPVLLYSKRDGSVSRQMSKVDQKITMLMTIALPLLYRSRQPPILMGLIMLKL